MNVRTWSRPGSGTWPRSSIHRRRHGAEAPGSGSIPRSHGHTRTGSCWEEGADEEPIGQGEDTEVSRVTPQLDRLAQLIEVDFSRGLALLRASAMLAEDLERLSALNTFAGQDRRKVRELVKRVHLVSERANKAAGRRGGVVSQYHPASENLTLPRQRARFGEPDVEDPTE